MSTPLKSKAKMDSFESFFAKGGLRKAIVTVKKSKGRTQYVETRGEPKI
jgi:hypothetical protein